MMRPRIDLVERDIEAFLHCAPYWRIAR